MGFSLMSASFQNSYCAQGLCVTFEIIPFSSFKNFSPMVVGLDGSTFVNHKGLDKLTRATSFRMNQ